MTLPPLDASVVEAGYFARLAQVVSMQPDKVAVIDDVRRLTYREFAAEAAGVLRVLRDDAAGPAGSGGSVPVAMLFDHRTEAVTALIGVLAAGRPVLVLDARTPVPRLRAFAERVGVGLVLADPANAEAAAQLGVRVQVLDAGLAPADPTDLWRNPPPGDVPAVLSFTSGSTGVPKVVATGTRQLAGDAWANSTAAGCYGADDVMAHTLPLAFNAGMCVSTCGPLVGTTMVMYDVRSSGIAGLSDAVAIHGVSVMHASPAILRGFVESRPDPAKLATLRSLTVAGESAYGTDIAAARAVLPPGLTLYNRYGSSETGLIAEFVLRPEDPTPEGALPAGRPVGHTSVVLMDEEGGKVRRGEVGRVVVRREQLALGYWDNPEATQAAFDVTADGWHWYASSDIGRIDDEGRLHLLGRRDHSVKVRGYLVEPGEVDTALFGLPDVREAVTVGRPRPDGTGTRLVSYVVPSGERSSGAGIRAALRQVLPGHMVPETVVFLTALPRTERGKLDRAALPEPPAVVVGKGLERRDEWQLIVGEVWQDVLGLDQIGPDDDFFELGGDSLVAQQLITAVIKRFDLNEDDVTTTMLAQAPTLGGFASRLKRPAAQLGHGTLVALRETGERPPLFMVAGGGGLAVGIQPLVTHLDSDQPVYAFQAHALERRGIPDWSVEAMARRHVRTLREFQPRGPYHLGGHSFGGVVAVEMAHQLRRAGEDVDLLVILDSYPPDPAKLPATERGSLAKRIRETVNVSLTGVVHSSGLRQFWRFHAQSQVLASRYKAPPWPGRTLVVVAASEDRAIRSDWGPYLSGEWDMLDVGADHLSMMREPWVAMMGKAIQALLDEVQGVRAGPARLSGPLP
ncbi:AMP-binding protein [Spongisporangium articulatum]|uniref:AMP-binding protein n=1 Tax=Spongisporangium articulatum TaxID=3362603 RepID=A0ABW8APE2_9ACTN